MKITRTINLNGVGFTIDEDAYQLLSDYLRDIEQRLPKEERKDVMADLEARIAELLQQHLFAHHLEVVSSEQVNGVMNQIGNPDEFGENKRPKEKKAAGNSAGTRRTIGVVLKVLLALVLLPIALPLLAVVFSLLMALMGAGVGLMGAGVGLMGALPFLGVGAISSHPILIVMLVVFAAAVAIIPIVILVHWIVNFMRTRRGPSSRFWWITIGLWIFSLIMVIVLVVRVVGSSAESWFDWDWDDVVSPTCNYSQAIDVDSFDFIDVKGNAKLEIYQSDMLSVTLDCDSANKSQITTEVRDGVLYVSTGKQSTGTWTILVPSLRQICLSGNSEVNIHDLFAVDTLDISMRGMGKVRASVDAHYLNVVQSGAGQLNLEGEAKHVDMDVSGDSKIEAEWLHASVMDYSGRGTSKAELNVEDTLRVDVRGANRVTYTGDPIVYKEVAGSSSVQKKQ